MCGYLFVALASYCLSLLLHDLYTEGDQEHYTKFYEALRGESFNEILDLQMSYTGSVEPIYGSLMWIGVNVFKLDKVFYISCFNSFLTVLFVKYLRNNFVQKWLIVLFLTNFYFLVIFTTTERLMFSIIFLLIIGLLKSPIRYLFALLAPLAHFQTIIFYSSIICGQVFGFLRRKKNVMTFGWTALFILMATGIIASNAGSDYIAGAEGKISAYFRFSLEKSGLGTVMISVLGLIIVKGKMKFFLSMIPIMVGVMTLGGDRVNMIGFMVLTHILILERRVLNPIYVFILLYFSFKSIGFVMNIINFGNGFP